MDLPPRNTSDIGIRKHVSTLYHDSVASNVAHLVLGAGLPHCAKDHNRLGIYMNPFCRSAVLAGAAYSDFPTKSCGDVRTMDLHINSLYDVTGTRRSHSHIHSCGEEELPFRHHIHHRQGLNRSGNSSSKIFG